VTGFALIRSELTKSVTSRPALILALVTILGTWAMAWTNAASAVGIAPDDPRLFAAEPIPLEYQGFEMAGFGYVLVVALAALSAGSEYGAGQQIRVTLLATPQRPRVFFVKVLLLATTVAGVGFLTMAGTVVITHAAGSTGVDPLALTPAIWANIGGVALAWTFTALIAFALGSLARSAILPLILITPLVVGVGDFVTGFWDGARYLPIAAGAALYSDPAAGLLAPLAGGLVQAAWVLVLLVIAGIVFNRRDL
jgi:ABC-2 type transport system permease protein